jgi:hypothetical protein
MQPHAGAVGLAILQTAADLAFLYAVWKRWGSISLAAAVTLLVGTTAHALAIQATIWNPSVALLFVKLACAAVLTEPSAPSMWRTALVTTLGWFAVQAHSAAIFVAAPLIGAYVLRDLGAGHLATALQRLRAIAEVILLLQLPFLYHALTTHEESAPTRALAGASQGWQFLAAADATLSFPAGLMAAPWPSATAVLKVMIAVCALVTTIRARRDLRLLSASVLPLACAAVGFAAWQGGYDEYWFIVFLPPVGLMLAATLDLVRPERAGLAALAVALAIQPWRLSHSRTMYRMPEYKALAKGSRTIYRQTKTIRAIETSFPMPPFSDEVFVYEAMGGRLDPDAEFDARIDANGGVQFRNVAR